MFTYHTGSKSAPAQAAAYANYLVEQAAASDQMEAAEYYLRTTGAAEAAAHGMGAVPLARRDIDPELAKALGLEPGQLIDRRALANLLAGYGADGSDLPGSQHDVRSYKAPAPAAGEEAPQARERIAYFDFTLSAPKSVSLAWAFAGTEAERASILQCHHVARDEALRYVEEEVGRAHLGHGREGNRTERARFGWIAVDHFAARPTVAVTRPDPATGVVATELYQVPAGNGLLPGDPQLHSHCIVPNLMRTESGRFVALNGNLLRDRVHEFGAVYQAVLARELRKMGVAVELDARTQTARVSCIPERAVEEFSKRTRDAEATAKQHFEATNPGKGWDDLPAEAKVSFLKGGAGASRRSKTDDLEQFAAWIAQGARIGWKHATAVSRGPAAAGRARGERLDAALAVADRLFAGELTRRAVLNGSDARLAAARGLIAEGIETTADVSAMTREMARSGVVQDGRLTKLVWREENGRSTRITTELHAAQEQEFVVLARKAAEDRSHGMPRERVDGAATALGIGWQGRAGEEQRETARAMADAGALGVFVGVHGVGKTTAILPPLVKAWNDQGREVWGVALGWKQARALRQAGVANDRSAALQPFLDWMAEGRIALTARSVVVVDEISQVGTRQFLDLLRHRDRIGFQIVATGDERQCQAIEAGPVVDLLRRALGNEAIPENLTTVRQRSEAERETALLFREGRAGEALARKRDDGTAELVPGGYSAAVRRVAELAMERRRANRDDAGFTLTISAPTNMDAHNIGLAVRALRRGAGDIAGADHHEPATDGAGNAYSLPLARGDRVRLFAVTRAIFTDDEGRNRSSNIGDNGTVLEVLDVRPGQGLALRNPETGKAGFVAFDALRDRGSGRIRLALGEALTVHSSQGLTSDEHISAMPGGSSGVNGFASYVAASRHRVANWIVASAGAELRDLESRRALGVQGPIGHAEAEAAAWANVARNLSRQPMKESALAFLEAAKAQAVAAAQGLQKGARRREARTLAGEPASELRNTLDMAQARASVLALVRRLDAAMKGRAPLLAQITALAPKPVPAPTGRPAPARPARTRMQRVKISEADAAHQLREAMRTYGLRPKETPVMDGKLRYVPVDGDKGNAKSGAYKAFYAGERPAAVLYNWKQGGFVGKWKADGELVPMSTEEARQAAEQAARTAAQREDERNAREEAAAQRAAWLLEGTKRADPRHPYLVSKGVGPHGARQDLAGRVVLPLYDIRSGRLRNLQTITPDGAKLYLAGAQKIGVGFLVGEGRRGEEFGVAEGFATAATVHEMTGKPLVVVLDTSNMGPAVRALREVNPGSPIFIAADNDHHLPLRAKPLPNAGLKAAEAVAGEVGARVVPPPEAPERAAIGKGTDWNDYRQLYGQEGATVAFRAAETAKDAPPAIPPAAVAARAQKPRQGPRARM